MGNILAANHRSILSAFAFSRVLIGLDYDGTLAPIDSNPARAHMRQRTRRLLGCVAQYYPCVVISGRSRADLSRRLDLEHLWQVIGNHGLEPSVHSAEAAHRVRDWVDLLRRRLKSYSGLVVEDKRYSVTLHYRDVRDKAHVRAAIASAVIGLPDVRVLGGKESVNLLLRHGANKGVALQNARAHLARDVAIYIGDDETDEDAFRSGPCDQLLAIRVGRGRGSCAHHHLESQADIDELLQALLAFRAPRSQAADRGRQP